MLEELSISDVALIERASSSFGAGLNVISGETGAGKSLVIDALELLLGQRARAAMVREGAERARVEGRFRVALDGEGGAGYGARVEAWLGEHLPETLEEWREEGGGGELELILARTVSRDGRSRAHVNHRPVTQRVLRGLASLLVEIHGQNDHQKLFERGEQLRLLDDFGGLGDTVAGYRERRAAWLELAGRLERFEAGEAERLQRLDLLRFQAQELERADPSAAEQDELVAERAMLRHAGELGGELGGLVEELSESEGAALDVLRRAERVLGAWEVKVAGLAEPAAEMREAVAHLEQVVQGLVSFVDGVEADPARLEEVEERLAELERLARKHTTDVRGLVARREAIGAELVALESEEQGHDELTAQVLCAREATEESARRLGAARAKLHGRLRKAVEAGLAQLGLERARFEVALAEHGREDGGEGALAAERRRLGPDGAEGVEFLLAANPGEARRPLREVASGGEVARIMLALRGALSVRRSTPTLVFDEVDAGVGGRLGPQVGEHLEALAGHHQILCVTHLAAIAARARRHLRVHKEVSGGRTRTRVARLVGKRRVEEVADMIAGGAAHATARAEARRLLGEA